MFSQPKLVSFSFSRMLLAIIVSLINRINAMVKLTNATNQNKDKNKLVVKAKVIKQEIKNCVLS